jgi:hypothetical protein
VLGTSAPPPHGASHHRSEAGSGLRQRYCSRAPADHRPHVSISARVPRGRGFLRNPPTRRSAGDPAAARSTAWGSPAPPRRWTWPVGPHASPGCWGGALGWRQPRPSPCPLGPRRSSASAWPTSRRCHPGFVCLSLGHCARGDAPSDAECPPSIPALGSEGQSRPQGICPHRDP